MYMKHIVQHFTPSWPSIVMGTGITTIALRLSENSAPWLQPISMVFFFLTLASLAVVTLFFLFRLLIHPELIKKDWKHPVAGQFFSTLPIAFVIMSINILSAGPLFLSSSAISSAALVFFIVGTLGIYLLGWGSAANLFLHKEIKLSHATFGWFIPPVSQLVVPVAGFELAHLFHGTETGIILTALSFASLGIGILLFLYVGANVYHRYVYHELPAAKMAPTIMIGLTPTAILVIILGKLVRLGILPASGTPWVMTGLWGFSVWWLVLSLFIVVPHIKSAIKTFELSWWSVAFPFGALTVATWVLASATGWQALSITALSMTGLLAVLWAAVAVGTWMIVRSGAAFKPHE